MSLLALEAVIATLNHAGDSLDLDEYPVSDGFRQDLGSLLIKARAERDRIKYEKERDE